MSKFETMKATMIKLNTISTKEKELNRRLIQSSGEGTNITAYLQMELSELETEREEILSEISETKKREKLLEEQAIEANKPDIVWHG